MQPARRRPEPDEYDAYYAAYVRLVPDGRILDILAEQRDASVALFSSISAAQQDFRYAPGKWTAREVVGHLIDAEWVFSYRALRIARGDETPLSGMDQEAFMEGANFGERTMAALAEEYRHLRSADLALFSSFGEEILSRSGTASDCRFTVRALLYIIAGHERHHVEFLKERYL